MQSEFVISVFGYAWSKNLISLRAQYALLAAGCEIILLLPLSVIAGNTWNIYVFADLTGMACTLLTFELLMWKRSKLVVCAVSIPLLFSVLITATYLSSSFR
jgi:hypothetical protein